MAGKLYWKNWNLINGSSSGFSTLQRPQYLEKVEKVFSFPSFANAGITKKTKHPYFSPESLLLCLSQNCHLRTKHDLSIFSGGQSLVNFHFLSSSSSLNNHLFKLQWIILLCTVDTLHQNFVYLLCKFFLLPYTGNDHCTMTGIQNKPLFKAGWLKVSEWRLNQSKISSSISSMQIANLFKVTPNK